MYHNSTDMDRRIYRLNKRDLSSAHALVQWCAYKRFCSIVTMSTFVQWCANTHLFNGALMLYAQLFPYFKSMYNCFAIAFLCGILRCDEWTCRCYMIPQWQISWQYSCTVLIFWTLIPCQLSTGGKGNASVGDLFAATLMLQTHSESDNDSEMETLYLASQHN